MFGPVWSYAWESDDSASESDSHRAVSFKPLSKITPTMFSSPTPASGSRAIAANALRNAGLIDRDAQMLDASDNPGGRKGSSRARTHRARKKESSGASARPVSSSFLMHVLLPRDYSTHSGNNDKQCQKLGVFLGVASPLSSFLCQVREWC